MFLHGKVLMEDGAPPLRPVIIQRYCEGMDHALTEGSASPKTGQYFIQLEVNDFGEVFSGGLAGANVYGCFLQASVRGFVSSRIPLSERNAVRSFQLPEITLTAIPPNTRLNVEAGASLPPAARRAWSSAVKLVSARDWKNAEPLLSQVVAVAPTFVSGWMALGTACRKLDEFEAARPAFERVIQADPKNLEAYFQLASVELELKDWAASAKTSQQLIDADTKHAYPDAYPVNALARYGLADYDTALARINEAIRLDRRRDFPRAELILAAILEARKEYDASRGHFESFIRQHPRAKEVAFVKDRLENLGKEPPPDLASAIATVDLRLPPAGDVTVPGGLKAFATLARLKTIPPAEDFVAEYCRAITAGGTAGSNPTLESRDAIQMLIRVMADLEPLGVREEDRVLFRLSLENDAARKQAAQVLSLLGWRLESVEGGYTVTLGPTGIDGLRQQLPAVLGIDEMQMREALSTGQKFEFAVPTESARLLGGGAWNVVLKGGPGVAPTHPLDLFTKDWRFASVYASLSAMDPETSSALVSSIGLANLIGKYAAPLADYGEAIALADQHVRTPGGPEADPVWRALAGADPAKPAAFLKALFEKDQGRLLSFYFDVALADPPHQHFLLANNRAEAFYKWYRESGIAQSSNGDRAPDHWQSTILRRLPLDASGAMQFPGGRAAWTKASGSDEEALRSMPSLQPMSAFLRLEEKRGAPFDAASAALLAHHMESWRTLFPYFERLPGLAAPQFQALEAFDNVVTQTPPGQQHMLLGYWHSLVELIVLAADAGSLDAPGAARAFGRVTEGLRPPDPSAAALAVLRELSGARETADIEGAVARGLLRLSGARLAAFDRVLERQKAPRLAELGPSPGAATTLGAVSGLVYAAVLRPEYLLVAEDPLLLSKHNFLPGATVKGAPLFAMSGLLATSGPPGSYFSGGFQRFREVADGLRSRSLEDAPPLIAELEPGPAGPLPPRPDGRESGPFPPPPPPSEDAVFRTTGRLVEVYATVTDSRGRYIDSLKPADFSLLEEGERRNVFAFENHNNSVTVALLFDTTGSMVETLPPLKGAALHLIGDLRPEDSVGVYSFNDRVTELQPFTNDKKAAERAVLRAHAFGVTALYDALVRINHDLAQHSGKKVILVFTDGSDNASMLTAETAILRAKSRGIPIYTIAQGEALMHETLLSQLAHMSTSTGGAHFLIRNREDIAAVFQKISDDLMHGYLLAFQPQPGEDHGWRRIELVLADPKGRKVRAREGYYPE